MVWLLYDDCCCCTIPINPCIDVCLLKQESKGTKKPKEKVKIKNIVGGV